MISTAVGDLFVFWPGKPVTRISLQGHAWGRRRRRRPQWRRSFASPPPTRFSDVFPGNTAVFLGSSTDFMFTVTVARACGSSGKRYTVYRFARSDPPPPERTLFFRPAHHLSRRRRTDALFPAPVHCQRHTRSLLVRHGPTTFRRTDLDGEYTTSKRQVDPRRPDSKGNVYFHTSNRRLSLPPGGGGVEQKPIPMKPVKTDRRP